MPSQGYKKNLDGRLRELSTGAKREVNNLKRPSILWFFSAV
jgi:hypothetical protein